MFYNKEHNQYVTEGTAFTLGDVQYPANWLNNATLEEKAAIGLQEVVIENQPADERFYWVSETLEAATLTYVNTPKDLDALKSSWKDQVNNIVYTTLLPSDYMPARAFETGEPMDEAWKTYRAEVRAYAVTTKAAIDASATVDDLAAVVTDMQWPNDPNYVAPVEPEVTEEV